MDIHPLLQKLGLQTKEIDIYLTCLEHGPATMTSIARLSGYKRSTIYHIIENLRQKGFVVLIRRNRRTYYDAEKPKKLLTALRARERELELALPQLESIRSLNALIPGVEVFDSEEAIRNVYDEIFADIDAKTEIVFFTSIDDLQQHAPYVLEMYLVSIQKKASVAIRELVFDTPAGRKYARTLKQKGNRHPVRLLPTTFAINNDIVLYKNKVAIFSFQRHPSVTVITNPEVHTTIKALYEWSWINGAPVR